MPDTNSFIASLFIREHDALFRRAYHLIGSAELAEDLVQEVFLLAVKNYSTLLEHPSPRGWLTLTLNNIVMNERRRIRRHPETSLEELFSLSTDETAARSLDHMLPAELSSDDREILIWRFEQQLGYDRIADRLGISQDAARARIARAVKRCAKLLSSPDSQAPSKRKK